MKIGEIFITSLFKFSHYNKLLLVKKFKTFIYLLLLAFIMLLGVAAKISPIFITYGSIESLISKELPEFNITDGRLTCKPYKFDDPKSGLYINIDPSIEGEGELPSGYPQAAVVTATNLSIRNNYKVQHEKFKDFPDFSKNSIVNFFNKYEKKLLIGGSILLFLVFVIKLAWNAVLYALLAYIVNLIFIHARLKYGDIYKLTIFAGTFAVLFNTLLSLVNIGFVAQIAPFITLFYVIKGTMSCRADEGIIIETLDEPGDTQANDDFNDNDNNFDDNNENFS